MPGKRQEVGHYLTPFIFYREVSAIDNTTVAAIDALTEVIDLGSRVMDRVINEAVAMGYNNILMLGVVLGEGVTGCTVDVYADVTPEVRVKPHGVPTAALGANKWCIMDSRDLTQSSVIAIPEVAPVPTKVVISAITGTAATPIIITYARSE